MYSAEPVAIMQALAQAHGEELEKEAGDLTQRSKWELVAEPAFAQHEALFKTELAYVEGQDLPVFTNPFAPTDVIRAGFRVSNNQLLESMNDNASIASLQKCGTSLKAFGRSNEQIDQFLKRSWVNKRPRFSMFDPYRSGRLQLLADAELAVSGFESRVDSFTARIDRLQRLSLRISTMLKDGDLSDLQQTDAVSREEMAIVDFLIADATETCRRSRQAFVIVSALLETERFLDEPSRLQLRGLELRLKEKQAQGGVLLKELSTSQVVPWTYPKDEELYRSLGHYSENFDRRLEWLLKEH